MRRDLTLDQYACMLCGMLLALLMALLLIPHDQSEMLRTFTPEHIEMNGFFDSRSQQSAHRWLAGLLGGFGFVILLARPLALPFTAPRAVAAGVRLASGYAGLLLIAGMAALFLANRAVQPSSNYYIIQGRYYALAMFPSWRTALVVTAFSAAAVVALWAAARTGVLRKHGRVIARAVLIVVAAYAAWLCALGLILIPDFHGFAADGLAAVEWHYSGNLGAGDQLAAGRVLGEVAINAGTFSAVLLGILERYSGMLNFGGHIRLVAALQLVFLLAAAAALWKWYGGRWGAAVLAFLLLLPWVEPLHAAVLYPNQSAWRFLGLAAGVLALVYTYRLPPRRTAAWLGLAGGLALSWNAETGICLCASYLTFLILRSTAGPQRRGVAAIAARFVMGLLAAIGMTVIIVRMGLGYWPSASAVEEAFLIIGRFSGGYGGLELARIDPLAALIFVHALFVVVRGLLRWAKGAVSTRLACRIAIATLIVLWAAYYFKAPHFWNLWSSLFLYGFLLGDLLPARLAALRRISGWSMATTARAMAVVLIVLPAIFYSNASTVRSAKLAARVLMQAPGCANGAIVSGVCLRAELAAALERKAASLAAALREDRRVLYFTSNSYLMPLMTGGTQPLRQRDPFLLTASNRDFDHLVAEVTALRPGCLLFDPANGLLPGSAFHRRFYERLRSALPPDYSQEATDGDWVYWCRVGDKPRSTAMPSTPESSPGAATRDFLQAGLEQRHANIAAFCDDTNLGA